MKFNVSGNLSSLLFEAGVSIASVAADAVDRYPWPEKYALHPPFDGYILAADLSEEALLTLLQSLKEKYLFGPENSWIIVVNDCFDANKIISEFEEGERVAIASLAATESITCKLPSSKTDVKIWSLHSVGNGSVVFEEKDFWNTWNDSISDANQLFEKPFLNFRGRVLRITLLGVRQ
ncbi:lig_chan-Glu_bd domain-containing protein [Caerostris darwini]|uniref:Lig_chan-Glu_bd domain-containing protein n=1 Tax=Caerostris darwini TaxID=1538125 RepID=A0AAV4SFW0_9ARAC|nr:lig_chan-Glu_bd domain-containing protein [Caerostris darwini]